MRVYLLGEVVGIAYRLIFTDIQYLHIGLFPTDIRYFAPTDIIFYNMPDNDI